MKCIRLDPNDPTCEQCFKRAIPCTDRHQGGGRYKQRRGRNLAAAEAAFGSASTAPEPTFPSPPRSSRHSQEALSDDSAEGRISTTESSRALMAKLLDQYLETSTQK